MSLPVSPIMEPEDIIRQQELQIRRLKEERDTAQEQCGRLLKALDEAFESNSRWQTACEMHRINAERARRLCGEGAK